MEQTIISKKQFDFLFNLNDSAILYIEYNYDDFKILYGNEQSRKEFLYSVEGKFVSEIFHKSRYEMFLDHCHRATENKKEIEYEELNHDEEKLYTYKITLIPSFTKQKVYFLCIFKKKYYKKQKIYKNCLLEPMFNNPFLYTILLSKEGNVLKANQKFLSKFHLDLTYLEGNNFFEMAFIESEHRCILENSFNAAKNGNSIIIDSIPFYVQNGELRYYNVQLSLFQLDSKDCIFIVMDEITEKYFHEKELKSTQQYLNNFRMALNSAAEVTITDFNGYILEVNERFIEQSGYTEEELIGKKHSILNSNYHSNDFYKNLWTSIKKGKIWRGELRNVRKDGTYFWNDCTIIPLYNVDGEIVQFLSVGFNITEKKNMVAELYNNEQLFKLITENTNDFIVLMNKDGVISYVSSAYERKLGYMKEELIGQVYTKVLTDESKIIWKNELSFFNVFNNKNVELVHWSKDGKEFWTESSYTIVNDYFHNKEDYLIMISREITERKEFENKLLYLAYHDALTQLPNRRYITSEFPYLLEQAKKKNESIAVLYVDGDNFKRVNDEFGHNVGDEFIYQFGNTILKSVRAQDVVVRMGGDEFLVVLTGLSRNEEERKKQIEHIITRLKENLEIGWVIDDYLFSATASIGIAFYPDHGNTLMKLLEISDKALYDIKFSSKNSYKIYDIYE